MPPEKKKRGMFSCSWWKPLQKKKVIKMSSFGTQSKRYIYKIAVIPKAQMTLQRTGQKDCKNRETRSLLQNSISLQCRMLHTEFLINLISQTCAEQGQQ